MGKDMSNEPYGGLPAGERVHFTNARIEAVIVEIRYTDPKVADSTASASKVLNSFAKFEVSRIEEAQQNNIDLNIGNGGKAESKISTIDNGWQVSDPEKSVVFTMMRSSASLQVRAYESWSQSLAPKLEVLLAAIEENVNPQLSQRIGLRYVNRLIGKDESSIEQWNGRISSPFLGPIGHPVLGKLVRETQQVIRLILEPGIEAILRQGPMVDAMAGSGSYLVDIDAFSDKALNFDSTIVLETAQRLNRTALSIFKLVLTESELDQMNPRALEEFVEGGSK